MSVILEKAASARESAPPSSFRKWIRKNRDGWLFASPFIIGFFIWTLGPMIASLALAFTEWDLILPAEYVGFKNFQLMFRDPLVAQSLKVTIAYAITSVPLNIFFGLVIALLLNARIVGLRFYRTAFYLPSVLSGVAVALLWRWLFSPEFGLINQMLAMVGIRGPSWLGDQNWALPSLVLMSVWAVGAGAIIYLAGLQGIPTEMYEAAEVDGARGFQRLAYITLPLMTPVLFFQLVVGIINALQVFTQAYIMTSGGPNNATLFVILYLYQNAFVYQRMGFASALAWVLFTLILLLTLLIYRTSNSWVYYEGESRKG